MILRRLWCEGAKRGLDASIHHARAALDARPRALAAYDALLRIAQRHGTLLSRGSLARHGPDVPAGFLALAMHARDWVRPAETWRPADPSPWRQFASIAEHLLARFPVPRFMASAWTGRDAPGEEGAREAERSWYKRLGRGESVRRLDLAVDLTRAAAHRFLLAPDHLTPIGAIRWAQVVAQGGPTALAAALVATRLGRELRNEAFWETVIAFFVRCAPELDLVHVGPIVDFLHHQRFGGRQGITASGELALLPAPWPDFSMKGRTLASLLRLVAEWHRDLGKSAVTGERWAPCGLRDHAWVERVTVRAGDEVRREARVWSLQELCSSDALHAEGRAMRHCVAAYAGRCARGAAAIWSLQVETASGRRRVLTIEVDVVRRRVVQLRRKFNARASEAERAAVERWAAREGLAVAEGA